MWLLEKLVPIFCSVGSLDVYLFISRLCEFRISRCIVLILFFFVEFRISRWGQSFVCLCLYQSVLHTNFLLVDVVLLIPILFRNSFHLDLNLENIIRHVLYIYFLMLRIVLLVKRMDICRWIL